MVSYCGISSTIEAEKEENYEYGAVIIEKINLAYNLNNIFAMDNIVNSESTKVTENNKPVTDINNEIEKYEKENYIKIVFGNEQCNTQYKLLYYNSNLYIYKLIGNIILNKTTSEYDQEKLEDSNVNMCYI